MITILSMKYISYGVSLRVNHRVVKHMVAKDLLLEARNMFLTASTRIEDRVLSQAEKLKAETISLVSRVRDLLSKLSEVMGGLADKIGDKVGDEGVYSLGKYLYIVFHKNGFVLVRTRPFYLVLSYDKNSGKLSVKSKNIVADITSSEFNAVFLAVKASIKIDNVKDYISQQNELRYIMKKFGRIVEQYLIPIIEARLKTI